jgi:16S rRNA (guanine527-N7)-methyltransferase
LTVPDGGGPRASAEDTHALGVAAHDLGLDLPPATVGKLVEYLDLLERWNRVYNLTAVRDRQAMRIQHLNDSLAITAALRRGVALPAPRILDVGSGAGLPGLVIALCWPEASVTCVDAVGKKVAFMAQAAATLGLDRVAALHARVESMPVERPFDVVTARAFAGLADIVAATERLLASDGVWALAKGRRPDIEIATVRGDVFHVEPLRVPELDAERHLVWIRGSAR